MTTPDKGAKILSVLNTDALVLQTNKLVSCVNAYMEAESAPDLLGVALNYNEAVNAVRELSSLFAGVEVALKPKAQVMTVKGYTPGRVTETRKELLIKKYAMTQQQYDLETRDENKLRLKPIIDETKAELRELGVNPDEL